MASAGESSILQYFKKGTEIEISSDDKGFRGSWYAGTVIRAPKDESSKVLVEYKTLKVDVKGKQPLRELLRLLQLRPPPPQENRPAFEFCDGVDAYYNDGWWEGVITETFEREDKYVVFFRGTREQLSFTASQLRLHREWVKGNWVPPLDPSASSSDANKTPLSAEAEASKVVTEHNFNPGDHVEASSDEDGFQGAWFPATVLEKTAARKYLIEYQKLMNDDDTCPLREEVDGLHLRPSPPDVGIIDRFEVNEQVDAFHNDCWWVGKVTKVLKKERYSVYFENPPEELKLEHSDLRVHQEWRNGKWHIASKVLNL